MAMLHGTMKKNEKGNLEIGGVDVVNVARDNEFPVYILDEQYMRENMRSYNEAFKKYYPNSKVYFASKAMLAMAICKIAELENFGLDVVSGGELFTALKADFPVKDIIMHGNNKSQNEIKMAIENSIGAIVIDNFYEIELIDKLTKELNKSVDVMLRIKPGVHADTHHYITTGHEDSKFGFIIKENVAKDAVLDVSKKPLLNFKGLHMHIGSQIFDTQGYIKSIEIMAEFIKELSNEGVTVDDFDLGGGLGVRYTDADDPMSINDFVKELSGKVEEEFARHSLKLPRLMVEPGRSIVGEAGTTVYNLGSITEVPGVRKYIAINGGMGDNIRPALYGSKYDVVIANKMNIEERELVTIAGKCCETGDILRKDVEVPKPESGDVVAVFVTGAYSYTMASNYNRLPVPGVMLVKDGKQEWIVKPQDYEDIVRNDIIPDRFK